MRSVQHSLRERTFLMAAAAVLGSGVAVGEARASDYCPEPPYSSLDFESAYTSNCPVCSLSSTKLTCTLTVDDDDNQLTIIQGFAAGSDDYSVFGVHDDSLFCCTYDDDGSTVIDEFEVNGSAGSDLLAFRFPFATGGDELDDTVRAIEATINGGSDNDVIYGSDCDGSTNGYDEELNGGDGPDTINGNAGDDVINGGDGGDIISGGAGADIIDGGNGGDAIHGDSGDDTISGGGVGDTLWGGADDDVLVGDGGDDVLCGGGDPGDELWAQIGDADVLWGFGGGKCGCSDGGTMWDGGEEGTDWDWVDRTCQEVSIVTIPPACQ
jgi:Ca2+-binding RTX toxin-like protein